MDNDNIYAVLNIGSTYISGMIARKQKNGCVSPIHCVKELSGDAIVHGCIHNIDQTVEIIKNIISKLNDSLENSIQGQGKINKVYVGIECQSMHTETFIAKIDFTGESQVITAEHLQMLRKQVTLPDERYSIIMVVDPTFYIDGKRELNPKGIKCNQIQAHYQLFMVRKDKLENVYDTFNKYLNLELAGILVSPFAEAKVCLNNEDLSLGCAYINIGGGCTSVAVFKKRLLHTLYVLPMGGINVTKDLKSLRLLYNDAEKLKVTKASLNTNVSKEQMISSISQSGISKKTLSQYEVNAIVAARTNEILLNALNILKELHLEEELGAGIILAGGATKIDGFDEFLNNMGIPYRMASFKSDIVDESLSDKFTPETMTLIGLITLANENCIEVDPKTLEDLFVTPSEDSKTVENDDEIQDDYKEVYTTENLDEHRSNFERVFDDEEVEEEEEAGDEPPHENIKKEGWLRKAYSNLVRSLSLNGDDE